MTRPVLDYPELLFLVIGDRMNDKCYAILIILLVIGVTAAEPVSGNISSLQLINLTHSENGFVILSPEWSSDGRYLIFGSFNQISMAESINKHYLLDFQNQTFGEINYGITEEESNYMSPGISWIPGNNKTYFSVSKRGGRGEFGGNTVICNPDGTNMRTIGSSDTTTLSDVISNLGREIVYGDLTYSPDYKKLTFIYEDSENYFGNIWIENLDGTEAFELQANANTLMWYNSTVVICQLQNGNIIIKDINGNNIRILTSPNAGEEYSLCSISPDRKKIVAGSRLENDDEYQPYLSNIDGSESLKIDQSNLEFLDETQFEFGIWQPNGSTMLLNENGDLYVIEGTENNKRLLYKGNATHPQWFPDGNKVLFTENRNQLYSIDLDGTNLLHITDIGLTTHYIWETYDYKQVSISPSGKTIAFTSAISEDGKIIDHEPSIESRKLIEAPLFTINSDGTNLTQITPAIKGRYDFVEGWSPDSKILTATTTQFKSDETMFGSSCLISLDGTNLTDGWKEMPVSEILGNGNKVQLNNSSQASVKNIEDEEITKEQNPPRSPAFQLTDLLVCTICVCLLKRRK